MKLKLLVVALLFCIGASAQSMFAPLPKLKSSSIGRYQRATTPLPDSTFTGFRFTGPMVLYALPNSSIFTGVGVSYEKDKWQTDTQKWYTTWSIALGGYAGGQFAPANVSGVTAVGLSISFFNKLLTIGALYNITNKNFQAAAGPGVSLNN